MFVSGSISEIVAKWLSCAGLDPTRLVDTTDIEFEKYPIPSPFLNNSGPLDEASAEEETQEERDGSMSVEVGNEAQDDQTASSYVLGNSFII